MSRDPLVSIGQGDSQRTVSEAEASKRGVPVLGLFSLWLAFAVLAWLIDLARDRH